MSSRPHLVEPYVAREHEFEAQHGLPEALPAAERILWQGAPRWQLLARQVFHADKAALYFAVMLGWRFASSLADGASLAQAFASLTWLVPLFALAVAALLLLGWLSARTTAYTLTDKRVVMRIGIVLTITYNLPLRCIASADLRAGAQGRGDIALALESGTRIAWLHLWPHVRPWRVAHTQPMLRGLENAGEVASLLHKAWAEVNGVAAIPARNEPLEDLGRGFDRLSPNGL
jgi:Bacterial PH domain